MKPEVFFGRILVAAILKNPEPFLSTHGQLAIAIPGKGAWTIRFGDPDEPIVTGFASDAELKVKLVPRAFDAFSEGTLDIPQALARKHLQVSGNSQLLDKLALIMRGGGSSIGARMAFTGKGRF